MQTIFLWDDSLETGNEKIDAQHKGMFATLNKLIAANEEGKAPSEIQRTVEFLVEYIIKHFADEERLQEECNYPYINEHKSQHMDLRKKVADLITELDKEGYNIKIVDHTIQLMTDWLKNHIKCDDFKLAAYIRIKDSLQ